MLRRQLESVNGVGQVLVLGGRQRQINVWLDADRLRAYNLTVTDVSRALQAQNIEIPGGRVDQGPQSVTLRTRGRVQTVAEFNDIVVREQNGAPGPDRRRRAGRGRRGRPRHRRQRQRHEHRAAAGPPAVGHQHRRGRQGSQGAARRAQGDAAAGLHLRIVRDPSEFIEASIHNVEEHLVVGSILAALVVLLFLDNLRSTIIAAIAIPTSIIATFGLMWYMGFTLNMMTMLALTLAVGIVIDDAIVVLENIYRFIEEKHENQLQAAIDATKEIGLAVLATTLSLVAIFVPVGFMGGIVGRFMKSFGLTMAFAIMVSLLVSFTLTPMLSARWLKIKTTGHRRARVEGLAGLPRRRRVLHAHARVVDGASRRSSPGVAVLVLLSSVPLFMIANKNFMPQDDPSEFEINLRAPEGTSLESTEVLTNRIASAMREQLPEVDYTLVTVGGDPAKTRNLGTHLRPAEADRRRAAAISSWSWTSSASEILPTFSDRPPDVGAAGRRHRRRRRAERGHPVRDQRPGPEEARSAQQAAGREGARRSRASSTSTPR